jgi:hypothetical protein
MDDPLEKKFEGRYPKQPWLLGCPYQPSRGASQDRLVVRLADVRVP